MRPVCHCFILFFRDFLHALLYCLAINAHTKQWLCPNTQPVWKQDLLDCSYRRMGKYFWLTFLLIYRLYYMNVKQRVVENISFTRVVGALFLLIFVVWFLSLICGCFQRMEAILYNTILLIFFILECIKSMFALIDNHARTRAHAYVCTQCYFCFYFASASACSEMRSSACSLRACADRS